MTFQRKLAEWIMNRVGGEDWSLAMRSEFNELEYGHLDWAMGCLGVAARSWFRREWRFILTLAFAPMVVVIWQTIAMVSAAPIMREWGASSTAWFTLYALVPLPVPLVLAWIFPRYALWIGFTLGALNFLLPMLVQIVFFGVSFAEIYANRWNLFHMPLPLGLAFGIGLWMLAAIFGKMFANNRRKDYSASNP